ncbi:MAG: AMP-binding protein [Deltaproteobacteria bacterium]|nr:AMP-binding protein [Deltaproteobacteria bacterium]
MATFPTFPPEYRRRFVAAGLWLDRTLYDYFSETVRRLPEQVAIVAGARRITFSQWAHEAERLAAGLVRLGLAKGDIVSVQLPNWPELCVLQVALARIGAVIQPMHMIYRQREIAAMLRFCDSRAVFLPASYRGFDYAAALAGIRGELPQLKYAVTTRGAHGPWPRYDDLVAGSDGLAAYEAAYPVVADDVFYLNFTSGTEGDPKGFLHTHNTLLSALKRFADMQARHDPKSAADVILANSPMSHSFGHLTTHQVLLRGIRMVLVEHFEPGETLHLIERERVTAISGTPAHLISLLNHPDFAKHDLTSVKSVGVGGAQCPPQLLADIKVKFGVATGNTYGMGENIVHTRTLPSDPAEVIRDTVGRPVPGAELKIFCEDHRSETSPGTVGEIAFRGPTLFAGYYKQPELSRVTRNDDGWFFTGDLGFVDERGYLHLAGRKKDMINRGGTKIFPKEIEDLLHSHPKILKAAVIGMPDYRLGERICAYVVPRPGETLSLDELRAYLTGLKVTKHKFPERLEVIDELPMTPTGKIKKEPLLRDIEQKLGAAGGRFDE